MGYKKEKKSKNDDEESANDNSYTSSDNETDNEPNQNSETVKAETKSELKNKDKIKEKIEPKPETFEPQGFEDNSEKNTSKSATVLKLQTQYFPYEKHVKNARQSFKRSFDKTRKTQTIINRMATAQQHINALLFEGFNVWIDDENPSLLNFDKLNKPTLVPKSWECVIELEGGLPCLEKFELE